MLRSGEQRESESKGPCSRQKFGVWSEMATHSSTLAWEIPWTEKPGRLQSMGSQRVGHE